jgi:type IV pilus assembly protein PilW
MPISTFQARFAPTLRRGLSLVELLVAMALMAVVTLAAVSLYTSATQSYRTVDANQELQSKARFAFEVITQAVRVAGYEDKVGRVGDVDDPANSAWVGRVFYPASVASAPYALRGFDNSAIISTSVLNDLGADGEAGMGGLSQSDSLAVRFYGSGLATSGETADGSMVDCMGRAWAYPQTNAVADIGLSLFQIRTTAGEPELHCVYQERGAPPSATVTRRSEPIVRGVESLQFAYALDTDAAADALNYPNSWRNAADLSAADWPRVRWVRVGMVIRGERGSAPQGVGTLKQIFPLGEDFVAGKTGIGYGYNDPNDTRLRRAFVTTIQLRNPSL